MQYTITWLEKKTTSTGKEKIDATLKDAQDVITDKVTIWGDFPNFDKLMPGAPVEGTLTPAKDPKYGPSLTPPRAPLTPPRFVGQARGANIEKAQERKAEYIEKAQDRKNESIAYFNAINSAIALANNTATLDAFENPKSTEAFITHWRDWFLSEWKKYEASDATDKHQPF